VDDKSIEEVRTVSRDIVLTRLQQEELARITMDFDGSVQSTKRHAEGSAVGFNKVKKGARSYYPLFCTVHRRDSSLTSIIARETFMTATGR
jgi:hypothetical protein